MSSTTNGSSSVAPGSTAARGSTTARGSIAASGSAASGSAASVSAASGFAASGSAASGSAASGSAASRSAAASGSAASRSASVTPGTTPGPSTRPVGEDLDASGAELAAQAEVLPAKPTKYMRDLVAMDRVRDVSLREGKTVHMGRNTNQDAVLGFTRGTPASPACRSCQDGAGPFTACIIVADMFKGSCTNCHYGSEGARCSFRPDNIPTETDRRQPVRAVNVPVMGLREQMEAFAVHLQAMGLLARSMAEALGRLEEE